MQSVIFQTKFLDITNVDIQQNLEIKTIYKHNILSGL